MENDILNTALTAMKGTLLVIVSISAAIIMICFCKIKKNVKIKKVSYINCVPRNFMSIQIQKVGLTQDQETMMVFGFFVLALFYFLPNFVLLSYQ